MAVGLFGCLVLVTTAAELQGGSVTMREHGLVTLQAVAKATLSPDQTKAQPWSGLVVSVKVGRMPCCIWNAWA